MKKLFSLLLVVSMLAGILVMPAAATVVSEVEPCAVMVKCSCGSSISTQTRTSTETVYITCGASSSNHKHTNTYSIQTGTCPSCGYQLYKKNSDQDRLQFGLICDIGVNSIVIVRKNFFVSIRPVLGEWRQSYFISVGQAGEESVCGE